MTPYWSTPIFSLAAPTAGCSNIGCPGDPSFKLTSWDFPPLPADADPGKPQTRFEGGAVLVKGRLGAWTSACLFFVERVRGAKRSEPRSTCYHNVHNVHRPW